MTEVASFNSPLTDRGVKLVLPAGAWNDIRTLMEGRVAPGLTDGRYHPHVVSRWRTEDGITAERRVFGDDEKVTVEAARPTTREGAAQLGALMVYAARAGQRVSVDVSIPSGPGLNYEELSRRACRWTFDRFGFGAGWPIKPSLTDGAAQVTFPGAKHTTRSGDVLPPEYFLLDSPEVVSTAYSDIMRVPREVGQTVFADLVGAPSFDIASRAFWQAQGELTPYDAAYMALSIMTPVPDFSQG